MVSLARLKSKQDLLIGATHILTKTILCSFVKNVHAKCSIHAVIAHGAVLLMHTLLSSKADTQRVPHGAFYPVQWPCSGILNNGYLAKCLVSWSCMSVTASWVGE